VAAPDARFCARCGRPLDAAELEGRRVYGVLAPGPMLLVTGAFLIGGVLALIAGSVGAAIFLLVLAGIACVFLLEAAKRSPESPLARRVTTAAGNVRGWGVFARESVLAWSGATRDVVRLKNEKRSLRREHEQALRSLGDAAYRGDEQAMTALRERLREIDDGLAERERAEAASLEGARKHVSEEHAAARPTEQYSVDELTSGENQ
jgi:hypothetical protein